MPIKGGPRDAAPRSHLHGHAIDEDVKVLMIEDDPHPLEIFAEFREPMGYEADVAENDG
jgi:hypothetical protein